MAAEDNEDDAGIPNDKVLWRRVHPAQLTFNANLNRQCPSSQAFQNTSGTSGMSVNIADETTEGETLKGYEDHFIVAFDAGFVRQLNPKQGVIRKPLPDNAAHAEVTGKKTKGVRRQFSASSQWVVGP